jgi:hypothetical protein
VPKNEARCKTLVDDESCRKILKGQSRQKIFYKKLSKDNLLEFNQSESIKRKESKVDINFMKKNLKLRKSQDNIEKPVRFNTEAYDKEEESYLIKLKKNSKKSKILTSSKNIKTSLLRAPV